MGMKWERWVPLNGVLFVAAFVAAFIVAGDPPAADAGAATLREHYANDAAILTSTYLIGVALFLYLSFLGTLTYRLREAGEARLAAVTFAGGLMTAVLYMSGALANAVLAYRTPADDVILQTIYDVQLLALVLTAFPSALLVAAAAIAASRTGVFPRWFNAVAAIAAVAFLVGGAAFASDGFFAPGGTYALIATGVFLVWAVVASVLLTTDAIRAEAPQAAVAPM